jgi:hypothetical protein
MGRLPSWSKVVRALAAAALAAAAGLGSPIAVQAAQPGLAEVRDGPARFQVVTPTVIRLEYAEDGNFEDRPTLTVPARGVPPPFRTRVVDGLREIKTSRLVLRYRLGAGPFDATNLTLRIKGHGKVRPGFPAPGPAPSTAPAPTVPPAEPGSRPRAGDRRQPRWLVPGARQPERAGGAS